MMAEQARKSTINANTIPSFKIKKEITSFTLGVIRGIRQNELGQFFIIFTPQPLENVNSCSISSVGNKLGSMQS